MLFFDEICQDFSLENSCPARRPYFSKTWQYFKSKIVIKLIGILFLYTNAQKKAKPIKETKKTLKKSFSNLDLYGTFTNLSIE